MTLKTRIIPCLDVKDGRVVKGVNYVDACAAFGRLCRSKAREASS